MPSKIVTFTLNGRETEVMVKPLTTLAKALREKLGYTATKCGCYEGNCGSCTVIVNGEPVLSCILPVEDVEGQSVLTLEGITPHDGLHPLQQAFFENYAVQCGFCTPGMIMIGKALLDKNPNPSREEIAEAMSGNLCRCTGYDPIIAAVQQVAGAASAVGNGHNGGGHE
jgi:carbon-monoxide dehydrogenase small subunit